MSNYARIVNNVAVDVVSSDPAQCFPAVLANQFQVVPDNVAPQWQYDPGSKSWGPPAQDPPAAPAPAPPAPNYGRTITRLAFMTRFTDPEAVAIDLASIGATVQAATIRRYLNKTNAAEDIQLDADSTRTGVQALEALGLIEAGRAAQILDAPVARNEVPTAILIANSW